MWVPEVLGETMRSETNPYNKVYKAEETDVLCDTVNGMCCLYTLCPGLPAFLRRTLSGARVSCHLSVLARRFMSRAARCHAYMPTYGRGGGFCGA